MGRVEIEHVHVQITLPAKAGEGEIAAAQVADDGVDWVGAEMEVELRVKRVREEQLHGEFLGVKLGRPATQRSLVSARGTAPGEPLLKCLRGPMAQPLGGGVVKVFPASLPLKRFTKVRFFQALHSDKQTALMVPATGPRLDERIEVLPTSQVEVSDAEIGATGNAEASAGVWEAALGQGCRKCVAWGAAVLLNFVFSQS